MNMYAQDSLSFNAKYVKKNNISIELGGVAQYYSLNYERIFFIKNNSFQCIRVGISALPPTVSSYDGLLLPFSYGISVGKRKSKLFLGIGTTFLFDYHPYPTTFAGRQYVRHHPYYLPYGQEPAMQTYTPIIQAFFCPMLGYEFISRKSINFKIYVNGIIFYRLIGFYVAPYIGLGLSYKFKNHK